MNEEQNTPEKALEAEHDTSKVFLGDSTLQSSDEFEHKDNDDYYAVDSSKKEVSTTIGDGEMRNEGTVGDGTIPDENPFLAQGMSDDQDEALENSGE
jgi:hypothetical protein